MVVLDVYTKNIKVKYKTYLLSKATLVVLLTGVISLVLPFVICYKSGGFRLKRDVVYEQPDVKFKGEYLFVATTKDSGNPVICSSFSYYNTYLRFLDSCSVIKVRERDQNYDGKTDSLHVILNTKVATSTKFTSIYLVLPLEYKLSEPCFFQMQSAIIYQETNIPSSSSKMSVFADLQLDQLQPLACYQYNLTYYNSNIIGEKHETHNYDLEEIFRTYSARNIKTSLKNILTTFIPTSDGTFTISLTIKYPEHKIYFKPRFWQILKFAWIQYLALYVVTSAFMLQIKKYIFDNNLVSLYQVKSVKNK